MRPLLDVSVLIALFDPDHVFHDRAHGWWKANAGEGWASCPITENGAVRIMSNPAYSQRVRFTVENLVSRLNEFTGETNHEFWPDALSLRDPGLFVTQRIHGSKLVTDLYLLALATRHGGRLATFDKGIPISGVRNAKDANLHVI